MNEATPRPWQLVPRKHDTRPEDGFRQAMQTYHYVAGSIDDSDFVADLYVKKDSLDAAHIVRCVNMHDGLVAACKAAKKTIVDIFGYDTKSEYSGVWLDLLRELEAALAENAEATT